MLLFLLLLEYKKLRPGSDSQKRTIATKEMSTCREAGSALFTMSYAHTHVPWQILAPSWAEGHELQVVYGGL